MKTKQSIWKGRYLGVIIMAALLACATGLSGTCVSLFIVSICDDFGIARSALLVYSSIMSIGVLFTTPLWGRMIQKHGLRKMMLLSSIASIVGLSIWALSGNIFMIYVASAVFGLFQAPCSTTGAAMAITQWFEEKRSAVMGYSLTFVSVSAVIGSAIFPTIIANNNWHVAFWIIVVFFALMTLPCAIFFKSPEECGMVPFGHAETHLESGPVELPGLTAAKALKSPVFYILWISALFVCMPSSFMANMPAWGVDNGFDSASAGLLVGICTLVGIFGVVIVGIFNEKFKSKVTTLVFLLLGALGFLMALFSKGSYALAAVAVALMALGLSYQVGMIPVIPSMVFGPREYNTIYASIAITATVAGIFFTPGLGLIYDLSGSYNIGIVICCACYVIGAFMILYSLKKGAELIAQNSK